MSQNYKNFGNMRIFLWNPIISAEFSRMTPNNNSIDQERSMDLMAITVRGKNLDITPPLKEYVEKRVKGYQVF